MSVPIAITGMGVVGPFGVGADALEAALREGLVPTREVERQAGFHFPDAARRAGLVDLADLNGWIDPRAARRMSLPSRLAVAAARMAAADASLDDESVQGREGAVSLGTTFGPTSFSRKILDQIRSGGPESVSPYLFMESVANVHAGQVALDLGLMGPNATLTQREAGTLLAVAQAHAYVSTKLVGLAFCGGVEELAPIAHSVLDRFGALSRGSVDGIERCRPFDADRDGVLVSEGAVVLVLEPLDAAATRGARVRGVLRACVRASDPTATAQGWGEDAAGLASSLRSGLDRSGVELGTIDRVVSGANGARRGDQLEAEVLRTVFRAELPPVLAPKGACGEYGAGHLGAAVLAAQGVDPWPAAGFTRADPDCGLQPWAGGDLPPARRVLVSALAAGGAACWLVLDAPPSSGEAGGGPAAPGPTS